MIATTTEVIIFIEAMAEALTATQLEDKGKQGVIIPYTLLYVGSGTLTPVPMVVDARGGTPAGPVPVTVR